MDVCLAFSGDIQPSGSGLREIGLTEVLSLFDEAARHRLVTRPYRNERKPEIADGICFCCDDCCEYFTKSDVACDKGIYIESTDMEVCNFCGDCVEACHFNARNLIDGELVLARNDCYGCGLCVDSCPEKCISMVRRPKV
jgi:Pyruvate/2-oxoacid:ferredoxin oxidoreductase delta subunit